VADKLANTISLKEYDDIVSTVHCDYLQRISFSVPAFIFALVQIIHQYNLDLIDKTRFKGTVWVNLLFTVCSFINRLLT
jgi:hypothetical protein